VPRDVTYHIPKHQLEQWQAAYDSGRIGLDILKKARIAGMPKPEAEAKAEAALDALRRMANAYEVELEE